MRDQARPFRLLERYEHRARAELLADVAIEAAVFIFLVVGVVGCIWLLGQP